MVTGKYYKVKGTLSCGSISLVYLISCQCCKLQYVGSVLTFEERFLIDKSDIGTSKKRCGAAKHFLECSTKSCFIYFNESHLKMMKNAFYLI